MSVKKVSDGDISKLKQEIYVEGRIISAWEHIEEVSEPVMEHARQVTEMPKNFIVNEEETMLQYLPTQGLKKTCLITRQNSKTIYPLCKKTIAVTKH